MGIIDMFDKENCSFLLKHFGFHSSIPWEILDQIMEEWTYFFLRKKGHLGK